MNKPEKGIRTNGSEGTDGSSEPKLERLDFSHRIDSPQHPRYGEYVREQIMRERLRGGRFSEWLENLK